MLDGCLDFSSPEVANVTWYTPQEIAKRKLDAIIDEMMSVRNWKVEEKLEQNDRQLYLE
jgi:hypothetical protein